MNAIAQAAAEARFPARRGAFVVNAIAQGAAEARLPARRGAFVVDHSPAAQHAAEAQSLVSTGEARAS